MARGRIRALYVYSRKNLPTGASTLFHLRITLYPRFQGILHRFFRVLFIHFAGLTAHSKQDVILLHSYPEFPGKKPAFVCPSRSLGQILPGNS